MFSSARFFRAVLGAALLGSLLNSVRAAESAASAARPVAEPQADELRVLLTESMAAKTRAQFLPIGARIQAFLAKYSQVPSAAQVLMSFAWVATDKGALTEAEAWQMFADSPHPGARKMATAALAALELLKQPLEISAVALDGRKVDLKELRGKVVLVDFWATWCHPCVAELPNVAASYKKFHDQGFEVVGIALEIAPISRTDTAEQKAAKLAKAREKLAAFVAARDLPWPQLFNPSGMETADDLSKRYAITAIPAMFLLDQNGMVVTTKARGEALEREVKRLLKL